MNIQRRDVLPHEYDELIQFDYKYLITASEIPADDAPPMITHKEIQTAKERGAQIFWVCTDEDEKVGYYWIEKKSKTLFLTGIAIATVFRGKKIASTVLKWVEESAKLNSLDECALAVSRFNKHAIHVYTSYGYHIAETHNDYFGEVKPNMIRLVMKKKV